MRFAAVVATFAGVALAKPASTHYETEYFTVTSCGPTVTDCPAASTQVSSTVIPVVTPPTEGETPVETPAVPAQPEQPEEPDYPVIPPPHGGNNTVPAGVTPEPTLTPIVTSSVLPFAETPSDCAGQSIETVSTFYVTTLPTVSYITHAAPCETETPEVPAVPTTPGTPSTPTPPSNGTVPSTTPTIPTGGASSMGASFALAAVAGAIALFA